MFRKQQLLRKKKSDLVQLGQSLGILNLTTKHAKTEWVDEILKKSK